MSPPHLVAESVGGGESDIAMSIALKYLLLVAIVASNVVQAYGQEKPIIPGQQPLTWTEFKSEEGRFRMLMPDKPKHEVLTYESGKTRLVHNTFTLEQGAFIWMVDYADLPAEIAFAKPAEFFNETRDELVRELAGTLQQQKFLTLGGYPGFDMTLRIFGGLARIQLYLVHNRLYQLLVTRWIY